MSNSLKDRIKAKDAAVQSEVEVEVPYVAEAQAEEALDILGSPDFPPTPEFFFRPPPPTDAMLKPIVVSIPETVAKTTIMADVEVTNPVSFGPKIGKSLLVWARCPYTNEIVCHGLPYNAMIDPERSFTTLLQHPAVHLAKGIAVSRVRRYMNDALIPLVKSVRDETISVSSTGWVRVMTPDGLNKTLEGFCFGPGILTLKKSDNFYVDPALVPEEAAQLTEQAVVGTYPLVEAYLRRFIETTTIEAQWILLAGLASPLFSLVDPGAISVGIIGPASKGKTQLLYFVRNLYQPSKHTILTGNSTANGLVGTFMNRRDIPAVVDEATITSPKVLRDMMFSEWSQKTRANVEGRAKDGIVHTGIVMLSSNRCLIRRATEDIPVDVAVAVKKRYASVSLLEKPIPDLTVFQEVAELSNKSSGYVGVWFLDTLLSRYSLPYVTERTLALADEIAQLEPWTQTIDAKQLRLLAAAEVAAAHVYKMLGMDASRMTAFRAFTRIMLSEMIKLRTDGTSAHQHVNRLFFLFKDTGLLTVRSLTGNVVTFDAVSTIGARGAPAIGVCPHQNALVVNKSAVASYLFRAKLDLHAEDFEKNLIASGVQCQSVMAEFQPGVKEPALYIILPPTIIDLTATTVLPFQRAV